VAAGAITPREAQAYGLPLSKALAAVHAAGLAHGAVWPATILLSGNRPVLSGFGAVAPGVGQPLTLDVFTLRNTSVLPWKAASQLPVP